MKEEKSASKQEKMALKRAAGKKRWKRGIQL